MANLLAERSWPEVAEYLQEDNRLILVIGSTEQHGRHMTFATDVWAPWEIALRASERTGVLLAPALNYGMSLHHLGFPGSLSLRPQTLSAVVQDLLESAYEHGFRRILILNGHGGNTAALQVALAEVLHKLPDLHVRASTWWREPEVAAVLERAYPGQGLGHADAGETSMILAIRPDIVRLERSAYNPESSLTGFLTRRVFLEHFPNGVIGADPNLASADVGQQVLTAAVQACVQILQGWQPAP
jgi:creatinine amidohydrolase